MPTINGNISKQGTVIKSTRSDQMQGKEPK